MTNTMRAAEGVEGEWVGCGQVRECDCWNLQHLCTRVHVAQRTVVCQHVQDGNMPMNDGKLFLQTTVATDWRLSSRFDHAGCK